jgi:predicted GH43/DUF377 family glycosyl hydrolase
MTVDNIDTAACLPQAPDLPLAPQPLRVQRLPIEFTSDVRRVITRFFDPGGEARIRHIISRVGCLCEAEVDRVYGRVLHDFQHRHSDVESRFLENYRTAVSMLGEPSPESMSRNRRLLIGSYFTMEYSIESAALFNPSIVLDWDQKHLPEGSVRFIMSLRATGEGHLSSIVFRTGVIEPGNIVRMDQPRRFASRIRTVPDRLYDKRLFHRKLKDIGVYEQAVDLVLGRLEDNFTLAQLEHALAEARQNEPERLQLEEATASILWLAHSNYQLELPRGADASEVVIFPQSTNESHGLEDLRMVRFVDDDGSITYFGTVTAYDGYHTLPQLIETRDFRRVSIHTLNGARAQNKGMALFPRKINGHYVMCSRIDGENLYIMYSDIVHFWESAELLQTPKQPWECVQMGNCGSPLETPAGWLLLTHGVGPVRTYSIGAMLLDLNDPCKVIGYLDQPLIVPTEDDRDGYVPNVVYTCGAMIHAGYLYIPYATSDHITRFAYVSLDRLLERLKG